MVGRLILPLIGVAGAIWGGEDDQEWGWLVERAVGDWLLVPSPDQSGLLWLFIHVDYNKHIRS